MRPATLIRETFENTTPSELLAKVQEVVGPEFVHVFSME